MAPEARGPIEARLRHLYSQAKQGTEAKREARELREHLDKLTPVVERLAASETARTKTPDESRIAEGFCGSCAEESWLYPVVHFE